MGRFPRSPPRPAPPRAARANARRLLSSAPLGALFVAATPTRTRNAPSDPLDSPARPMADALLVLLVLVASPGTEGPRASPVAAAMREALGPDATVVIEERTATPSHAEAEALATRLRASAVAEVSWTDATASRAHLDLYLATDRGWHARDLGFGPSDTAGERERATGLFVGALVKAASVDPEPAKAPPPAPAPPAPTPPPPPPSPAASAGPPPRDRRAAPTAVRSGPSVDVAASGAGIVGDAARGLGPAGAIAWAYRAFDARASVAVRFGSIPDLDASTLTVRIGLGPSVRVLETAPDGVAVDLGVQGIALHHVVTRDAPAERRSRWLGGALGTVRASWQVSRWMSPFVSLGAETAFGATPLDLDGRRVATLPVLRTVAELGATARF